MNRLVPALLFLVACAADVGEGRVAAKVEDVPAAAAKAAPAAAPAPAAATTLAVDPARSKLGALGAKITAQHPIVFHRYDGKIGLSGDTVTNIAFDVDVDSLESDHPKLTAHLKTEDFLDVGKHPKATFRSTEIRPGSDVAGHTHTVTGDLTIRGKTKRVTFPAKITVGASDVTASSEFVIDRRDFDVVYPGQPDDLVQDKVALQISFVAPRSGPVVQ